MNVAAAKASSEEVGLKRFDMGSLTPE
jgi:hypothetical protein